MSFDLFGLIFVICGLIYKISCNEDCWYPLDNVEIGKMCYYGILDDDPDCTGYASCAHATYINQSIGDNEINVYCYGMLFVVFIVTL